MSSPIRLTGMATGLDTDTLVKQLMQAKRIPVDKMKQQQQILEWRRDAYRDMNTLFSQFKDMTFNMKLQSTMSAKQATSSNTAVATATASTSANTGTTTLDVIQLAKAAQVSSANPLGLGASGALNNSASTLTVAGEKGTMDISIAANTTIQQVVLNINAQSNSTGVRAVYDKTTDKLFLTGSNTGSQAFISLSESAGGQFLSKAQIGGAFSSEIVTATGAKTFTNTSALIDNTLTVDKTVTLNGYGGSANLSINASTTFADLQDQLSRSGLGGSVTMSLDSSGKVRFQGPAGGNLTFSGDTSVLGLDTTPATSTATSTIVQGVDAQVKFNGNPQLVSYHSNNFTFGGINFSIKQVGSTSTTVDTDVDGIVTKIKAWVDKYNEIIDKSQTKMHEGKMRSFQPLTDDQRKAMKDDEIKLWEDKAKQGLLQNDSILSNAVDSLRSAMSAPVTSITGGQSNMLSSIGIKSSSYLDNGKLTIDETTLKNALTNNPDSVMAMFTNQGVGDSSGAAVRVHDHLGTIMTQLKDKAGSSISLVDRSVLGKQITDFQTRVNAANYKMADYEQQYYSKFAKLEQAMMKAQSQSSWLSSQLGGGN